MFHCTKVKERGLNVRTIGVTPEGNTHRYYIAWGQGKRKDSKIWKIRNETEGSHPGWNQWDWPPDAEENLGSQALKIPAPCVLLTLFPPWVTASRILAGNRKAELKLISFSSLLLFRDFLSLFFS